MDTHDPIVIPVIESGGMFAPAGALDFTRFQVTENGRVHSESRCNHCGLRIMEATSVDFDEEERAHTATCEGPRSE